MTTDTVFLVSEEQENWSFNGDYSECEQSWVPLIVFATREEADEYVAANPSTMKVIELPLGGK